MRKYISCILLVLIAIIIPSAALSAGDSQREEARIHAQKAGEFIKENNWSSALEEAKKSVKADSKYPEGHLLLGIIYVKLGELDNAEKQLKNTMDLNSDIAEAYTYMGKVYYYRDKLDKALEYYKKAVAKGKEEVLAYQDMGHIYYQKSREALNSSGNKAEANEKMSLAVDCYKKALQIDPKNSELHNFLGAAYYYTGKTGNALGEYEKAIELDKKNASAYSNLGEYYFREKKDFPKATEAYKTAIDLYTKELSGKSGFNQKEIKAKQLELALCHYGLGYIYNVQGQASPAIEQFNKVLKFDANNAEAYVGLASSFELAGDKQKAIEYFKKALKIAKEQNNTALKNALEAKLKKMGAQ